MPPKFILDPSPLVVLILLPLFRSFPSLQMVVVIGILTEEMDLVNYVIMLGKSYLWNCRCKDIKPSISHFERILEKKYETEKYIAYKSNRIISFHDKWKPYEELFLSG